MLKECLSHICGTTSHNGTDIDMVSMWTFCLVLATLLLYLVARYQLSGISKTTKADFIKQFNNDFFVEPTRNVIMLLDYDMLEYKEKIVTFADKNNGKVFPYFVINDGILSQLEISDEIRSALREKRVYSGFEIDDLLLGRFEDIGLFVKQNFLNIKDVCNHFSWYIDVAWQNNEIQKYIKAQRNLYGDTIYNNFEYVYNKCNRVNTITTIWLALRQRLGGMCE
jgi:hypothetical protein